MNLDELQSVRDSERRTDSLQQLRESFYAEAGEFVQELRDRRERAADRADDPFDAPEVDRLTNEINAAEETVEAIYEKRLGKLVKAASLAAADMPAGSDGMTTEEQQLFDTLVEDIRGNRRHVLDVLGGEQSGSSGPADADADAGSDGATTPDSDDRAGGTVDAAAVMGEPGSGSPSAPGTDDGSGPASAAAESGSGPVTGRSDGEPESGRDHGGSGATENGESAPADVDRERVRITADVGAIFGVDEREYDLSENDVVQLPRENAEPLLERDAAERL